MSSRIPLPISKRKALNEEIESDENSPLSRRKTPIKESSQRRFSLVTSKNSPLSTPPMRLNNRLSLAYGMKTELIKNVKKKQRSNVITVAVRKRPLTEREQVNGHDVIKIDSQSNKIQVEIMRMKLDGIGKSMETHEFRYDKVFDEYCDNETVYQTLVQPLVKFAIENGGNSTCFAYGQTGSGKTHTVFHEETGLCYLAAEELIINSENPIYLSFYEIYQGQLLDLLNRKRKVTACEQRDGTLSILGLCEVPIGSVEEAQKWIRAGLLARITGSTAANHQSSRSHAILHFVMKKGSSDCGRVSFIDLAGSERGADRAEVSHQTKMEGSEINKSLLALKECIRAMDLESSHVPFRQSKLTLVLRDSLVGDNIRTCMIATVSPSSTNSEHSLNTLRYADRMKEIDGTEDSPPPPISPGTPLKKKPVVDPYIHETFVIKEKQASIKALLKRIDSQISSSTDLDVLKLLEEELKTLESSFSAVA